MLCHTILALYTCTCPCFWKDLPHSATITLKTAPAIHRCCSWQKFTLLRSKIINTFGAVSQRRMRGESTNHQKSQPWTVHSPKVSLLVFLVDMSDGISRYVRRVMIWIKNINQSIFPVFFTRFQVPCKHVWWDFAVCSLSNDLNWKLHINQYL